MRFYKVGKVAGLAAVLGFAAGAYGQVNLNPITTPATVGTTVVVQGTGFPAGTIGNNTVTVTITPPSGNGAAVTTQSVGVTAIGAQRLISFTIPSSLVVNAPVVASVSVSGTTAANNRYTTATPATLTVNPPPKISDVSPAAGTVGAASLAVSIAGRYTTFQNSSTVTVSGTGVTAVNKGVVNSGPSSQSLNATFAIAAGAAIGARDVTVKTGTQTVTLPGGFIVSANPGLSFANIGPNAGQLGQTLDVTVTGINTSFSSLPPATFVDFGDGITVNLPLKNVTANAFTANITISPTTYLGGRMVTAVTGGQFAVSGAQGFTITPGSATLSSVSPNSAVQATNVTSLVVMGANTHFLQNATTLSMGAGINVGNIQVDPSGLKLTANIAVSPTATVGPHDVIVTTGGETETLAGGFTVVSSAAPFLSGVSPNSGAQGTAVPIQVTGVNTNFLVGTITADLGSNIATTVTPAGANTLTINAVIDPLAFTGNRTAILHDNGTDFNFAFTVTPSNAQITNVTPNSGPQGGNPTITVTGLNTHWVQGTTTASVAGCCTVNRITITPPNTAVLDISIPAGVAIGPYTLTLATGGEVVTSVFSVFANTTTLTVSPGSGMIGTTVPINLTGQFTNFNATTTLNISGEGVLKVDYDPTKNTAASATAKLVIDPAAPLGPRTITMTTGTQVVTTTFLVTSTPAVLTSISPNDSPRNNTLIVTIKGQNTNFDDTTSVGFGPDVTATILKVDKATQTITASVTVDNAAAYGWRTCFVNTGAEQLQIGFRIDSPATPVISGVVNPSSGEQGQTITGVVITGTNTNWDNTTQLFLGAGVTAVITNVLPTQITATISISSTAPIGPNSLVTITGSEIASGAGFTVTRGVAQILSITPTTLVTQNQTLILTLHGQATHWLQGETTANFGPGVSVDSLTIGPDQFTATAQITVLSTAPTGFHTVTLTTDGELASINQGIDVEQGTPVLLSSTPNAGPQGETMNVQVLGQFTTWKQGSTTASYSGGGVIVNSVSVQDSVTATLNVTVDPLAMAAVCYGLTVTTGTEQVSLPNQFCVSPGPAQITGVNPVSSLQGSTVTVQVTGLNTHFTSGVTTANFGQGINVSNVRVNSNTSADVDLAVSVNAATGLRNVSLQTGGEVASMANAFTVSPGVPTLNGVAPVSGLQGTSISVRIIGQFTHWTQGTTTATFGQGITVNSLTIDDPQTADASITIDPLAYTGSRAVTITTNAEIVSGSLFTVTPGTAIITGISPSTGNQGQERVFTITGQNTHWAEGITQFSMAGVGLDITVNGFVVNSPTSATADIVISPNASLGARGIYITTAGEVLSDPGAFVVTGGVPSITFLSPASGNPGATQLNVSINGVFTNWTQTGTTVDFGPCVTANGLCISLVNYTVNSNTSITAVITIDPTAPVGFNQVTVRTGNQALTSAFQVVVPTPPIPVISYFSPSAGLPGQTFTATFSGRFTQWDMTTQVTFGAGITVNNFQVVTPTSARANITIDPLATAGQRTVTLTTGTDGEVENTTFSVVIATPYISIIDPSSALQGETGKDINVVGQYTTWDNTTTFSFGAGVTINSFSVLGPDIARVNIAVDQLAALGNRSVTANTGTHTDTGCCFTVTPSLANISSIAPNTALQNDTPTVSVVGQFTHWSPATTFTFSGSGISVTGKTFVDQTHYTLTLAIAPLATLGTHGLTAITGGESAGLSSAFVVQPGTPLILSSAPAGLPQQGTLNLTVLGQDTSWTQAGTTLSFGPNSGINVLTTTVTADGLGITGSINAAPTAFTGFRTLSVTTGSQVLTLPNAIFVTNGPAVISQLNPNNGQQNQSGLDVVVTGTNTNFTPGVTTANFGQGITINSVSVSTPTSATVNISIAPTAATTTNSVSLFTLGEVASAASAFTINPGVPKIDFVNPSTAKQGETKDILITAAFTHFAPGNTTADFGSGVTVNSVNVADNLHATVNITVTPTTMIGARNINFTTNLSGGVQEIVSSPGGFDVVAGPAAITSAVPTNPITVRQGDSADVITITGTSTNFTTGVSTVAFCSGVNTTGVQVQSLTSIIATVLVSATAQIGNCGVTVTTQGEVASGSNLFTVFPGIPAISQLSSTSASQGDTNVNITVTGAFTHFVQGTTTANFGAGVSINSVAVGGQTTATVNISVSPAATLGARDVTMTTGTEVVTLSGGFVVLAPVPTMVSGVVSKPDGSAAAGATVILTPASGGPVTTTTDGSGSYGFSGIPLGSFMILASDTADNLAASATGSLLSAGQQITLNIQLALCSPPPSGLIHWWPGDGNANDVVSGANGTLQSGATFGAGKVGQGFSFNNAGYVSIPAQPDMNLTAVTLEGWVLMNSLPPASLNSAFVVATKGLTTTSENYGLYITSNGNVMELMFEYYNGGFQHLFSSGSGLTIGSFHHVGVTADGASVTFYVDGKQVSQVAQPSPLIPNASALQIASGQPNYPNSFNGIIDELSLYNRALTAIEIQTVFDAGTNGKCKLCVAPPSNLVSWWTGDSDTSDLEGANNSVAANAVTFVPAVVGSGFKIGTNGYIDVPANVSLANQQFTWSAWVRPDGAGPVNDQYGSVIIVQDIDNFNDSVYLDWRATDSHFLFGFGGASDVIVSQNAFPVGRFYHVAGTYDGATFKLYVNGNLEASLASARTINYSAIDWTIGNASPNIRGQGVQRTWNGVIDEVQAFSRALSISEIQGIYTAGSAGECRPASGSCSAPPSGLAAWWTEDGTLLDATNNNNPAGSNNISFVRGRVGLGAGFGSGSYIDIPEAPGLENQRFTLSAWVRPDGPGPNNDNFGSVVIEQDVDGSTGTAIWWSALTNRFLFGFGNISTEIISSTDTFLPGQFYLVTATYDGATFSLYVNGKLEGTHAEVKTMTYSTTAWTIGSTNSAFRGGFSRTWNGVIDEVQIFNRALTQAEIQAIYTAGSAGECKAVQPNFLKPVAYSMQNGQTGAWHYWDDTYNGTGSHTTDGAALSGGFGQLTDGYVAAAPYTVDSGRGQAYEWVGWDSIQPTIVFDFGAQLTFRKIGVHSHNQLDVPLWTSVILDFSNDGVTFANAVTYTTTAADKGIIGEQFINIPVPSPSGRYVRARFSYAGWMMISEVQFQ